MPEVEIVKEELDRELPRLIVEIDGQPAPVHCRTPSNGGQKPAALVEDGAMPIWEWDGDAEEPTLTPSVTIWDAHFYVRDGEIDPADDQTTVPDQPDATDGASADS